MTNESATQQQNQHALNRLEGFNGQWAMVVGASGAIGAAVVDKLLETKPVQIILLVSSQPEQPQALTDERVVFVSCNYAEESIIHLSKQLRQISSAPREVYICNGLLHGDDFFPERRLEDITQTNLHRLFQANSVVPFLWVTHLLPLLIKGHGNQELSVVAVLSARVGSISDNRLGGWYSYRTSKAALNMLLKTASIEYARRAKNVKLIAFHPGTTDSPLSRPFQARVPEGKLFEPAFVAERLVNLCNRDWLDHELEFIDWDGKNIEW